MRSLFYSHANKTHFHKKDFALSLVLKVKVFGTRKWPIIAIIIEISEFRKTRSLFKLIWNFQVRVVRKRSCMTSVMSVSMWQEINLVFQSSRLF